MWECRVSIVYVCVYENENEQFVFPFRVFIWGNTPKIDKQTAIRLMTEIKNGVALSMCTTAKMETKTETEIKRKEMGGKRHSSLIVWADERKLIENQKNGKTKNEKIACFAGACK